MESAQRHLIPLARAVRPPSVLRRGFHRSAARAGGMDTVDTEQPDDMRDPDVHEIGEVVDDLLAGLARWLGF